MLFKHIVYSNIQIGRHVATTVRSSVTEPRDWAACAVLHTSWLDSSNRTVHVHVFHDIRIQFVCIQSESCMYSVKVVPLFVFNIDYCFL